MDQWKNERDSIYNLFFSYCNVQNSELCGADKEKQLNHINLGVGGGSFQNQDQPLTERTKNPDQWTVGESEWGKLREKGNCKENVAHFASF